MFQALFTMFFNLLATLVQVVLYPLNLIITNTLPDLTEKIDFINNNIFILFTNFIWFFSIIPPITRSIVIFAIDILLVKYTISISTKAVIKIWNLFQKLKFW